MEKNAKNTENAIKERGIKLANELAMEYVTTNVIPQIKVYWDLMDEEAKKEMWEKDVEVVKDHTIKKCGVAPTNLNLLGEYIRGWYENYEKFQTGDWLPNPNLMRKIFRTY